MDFTEEDIVESYTRLLEGLSPSVKLAIAENLSKSNCKSGEDNGKISPQSFGGYVSEKSPEEIIKEIKESRKFKMREIKL